MSWVRSFALALLGVLASHVVTALPAAEPMISPGQAALQELRTFSTTGRVLHIGAHPDDENTQLIAYLSRGRGYDTAYLSITRGDGGQNLLGPQFDEKLGVARTQELLAARRIDGGRQFFTRAIDFGFSKNPEETLSIWNHREVLGDVVRVIRTFRPDVIITRFPIPPGSGGHGHHTASAILAVEAFKLAADPTAYPEQLRQGLSPWQAKRIVWNAWSFGRGNALEADPAIKVDIAGNDPVTGESFASIATRSRRMHKTQAMGEASRRDIAAETFVLLGGEPMEHDFMDGVDTTWARVPGGAEIGRLAADAVAAFDPVHPDASLSALLAIRRHLSALPASAIVTDKHAELDRVLTRALGLVVHPVTTAPDVVPGENVEITTRASANVPLRWLTVEAGGVTSPVNTQLIPGTPVSRSFTALVGTETPLTQPYWLREPPATGLYRVAEPTLIGRPENPPELPVRCTFQIEDQTLTQVVALEDGPAATGPRHVVVVPPVSLELTSNVAVFRPGQTKRVDVQVVASRPAVKGTVALELPTGWRATSDQPFDLAHRDDTASLAFEITAPNQPNGGAVLLHARVGGRDWTATRILIEYPHIPPQVLQPAARLKVVSVDVATRGHSIGYITGAGDDVPQALEQLGYAVTLLPPGQVKPEILTRFDAVVIGVRAFNTRDDLVTAMPALAAYVEQGGTVVAQYNWARNLKTEAVAPFRLKLSDSRVTNEEAPVTFLVPEHPALTSPNRIVAADFDGWVQERGVYFPTEWDEHFVPLLSMNDPGEKPLQGSLLVARHGKGYYVYTGLAFFRELPAGVPGAYRLFANLISLGK